MRNHTEQRMTVLSDLTDQMLRAARAAGADAADAISVSYTHLTLPTIYSV